jgi:hypothetical protein
LSGIGGPTPHRSEILFHCRTGTFSGLEAGKTRMITGVIQLSCYTIPRSGGGRKECPRTPNRDQEEPRRREISQRHSTNDRNCQPSSAEKRQWMRNPSHVGDDSSGYLLKAQHLCLTKTCDFGVFRLVLKLRGTWVVVGRYEAR